MSKECNYTASILESISDGVFTVDGDWKVVAFNRAAEEITGISREEAIGSLCSDVFKSNMCETGCALRQTLDSGSPVINKTGFIIRGDGERIPVSISTAVLKDENGAVIGGAETFRDLSEVEALKKQIKSNRSFGGIESRSKRMNDIFDLAEAVADSPSSLLIEGETGTGKEVLANAVHNMSSRKSEPFIALNCGALPDSLLESELFGYKKGAFTGAEKDKPGRFALAGRGTLFLDEIGDISPAMQVKLLRVLQERCFEPLGGTKSEKTEARVIAATHRNLKNMVAEGSFRQDLFYRINVVSLQVPPLRDRKEDIPLLVEHFINKFNAVMHRDVPGVAPEIYSILMSHDWPGNVRELENMVERAFVLCGNDEISIAHLPDILYWDDKSLPKKPPIRRVMAESERSFIINCLKKNNYNRSATARELGIHKTTLYRKVEKLGVELPEEDGRYNIL